MDVLAQLVLDTPVTLKIDYALDSSPINANFKLIKDFLKQLQAQANSHQIVIDKMQHQTDLSGLKTQVDKNSAGLLENIKEINQLTHELRELKNSIPGNDLHKNVSSVTENKDVKSSGINLGEALSTINKEMHKNSENIKELQVAKSKTDEHFKDMQSQIDKLREELQALNNASKDFNKESNKVQSAPANHASSDYSKERQNLLSRNLADLQRENTNQADKIADISEKLNEMSEGNRSELEALRNALKEEANNSEKLNSLLSDIKNQVQAQSKASESIKKQINKTSTLVSSLSKSEKSSEDPSKIKEEIMLLKDTLDSLINRLSVLEKSGSNIKPETDRVNPERAEKLPSIHRNRAMSVLDHKSFKKELNDLKQELESWVKSYVESSRGRDSLEDFAIKLQEFRNLVNSKADQEGMKKGLMFLESKITQLIAFMSEPGTEDAMIARRGFNCLSCSKNIEKLRGRLAPRTNWNQMTTTGYSPPKVGYSKHLGDQSDISPDRQMAE